MINDFRNHCPAPGSSGVTGEGQGWCHPWSNRELKQGGPRPAPLTPDPERPSSVALPEAGQDLCPNSVYETTFGIHSRNGKSLLRNLWFQSSTVCTGLATLFACSRIREVRLVNPGGSQPGQKKPSLSITFFSSSEGFCRNSCRVHITP